MKLLEIYESLQGEFPHIGLPCTIVRLAGCNLACSYCDAPNEEGTEMSVDEVAFHISQYGHYELLITGGEPLLQANELHKLCQRLDDYSIVFETNGTQDISPFKAYGDISMDVKLDKTDWPTEANNLEYLGLEDCLKFVYDGHEQFLRAIEFLNRHADEMLQCYIVFSPVNPKECFMPEFLDFAKEHDYWNLRMQVQLHKVLEVG